MDNRTAFVPIRGTEESIRDLERKDGYIYYAYDTGRIYMDKGDQRISMGGNGGGGTANGASIYYGVYNQKIKPNEKEDENDADTYNYPINSLEDKDAEPRIDDMILDENGTLYRIQKIEEKHFLCTLLPLSGNGTGGGAIRPDVRIETIANPIIVNGQDFELFFVATSAVDDSDTILSDKLMVSWSLIDASTSQVYHSGTTIEAFHGQRTSLHLGAYLKDSTNTIIKLQATGTNHLQPSYERTATVTTVEMKLETSSDFNPLSTYKQGDVTIKCDAIGKLSKILEWRIDGKVIEDQTRVLGKDEGVDSACKIPDNLAPHGYHLIEIYLYQNLGSVDRPIKGLSAEPLKFEIAVTESGNMEPIIWFGDYQKVYYNYDNIIIPFIVYNPANTSAATVTLYKNGSFINDTRKESNIEITKMNEFYPWQIADATEINKQYYYSVGCEWDGGPEVMRDITFTVLKDELRNMTIVQTPYLKLNFDPAGRSNSEPAIRRATWSYGPDDNKKFATFENFNWYNNGWHTDKETKNTFLRISNGATFKIPFENLTFGTNSTSQQSNSIELAFKIRNIQNYSNLITNVTRYNIPVTFDATGKPNSYRQDTEEYEVKFKAPDQKTYTNYDAFLQATLEPNIYDNLQFREVQKLINLDNLAFGFYSGSGANTVGVCVGPQDAFFSNGKNTVNVPFVEGEMIYLSFVYQHHEEEERRKLFIYINGCITGVITSSADSNTGFTILSDEIKFESNNCDIDLYKMRIYNTALSVNDIVTNYAVDKKDIVIYDQNQLASNNKTLDEYQLNFNEMLNYNSKHPDAPLMPYIIYDTSATTDNDKLPHSKAQDKKIRVEFVNVPLDAAYARGELVRKAIEDGLLDADENKQDVIDEAVRIYYEHNCPSWTSTMSSSDSVAIEVQGTSSEFYPRRNYKIKTKYGMDDESNFCVWGDLEDDDGNKIGEGWTENSCLNIFMHKGPYEKIFDEDKEKLKADSHYYGSEKSRMSDGWYMNNYTNPTDRWTMKVDYMESSGSYNAGFASLVGNAYTKHPLKDYLGVLDETDEFKSELPQFQRNIRWEDFRTSLLGFPVMAFHKRKKKGGASGETECVFIGYYRMLLDKGSDQVLGFKAPKKVTHKLLGNEKLRDVAECWEFSTNARTFCSYRDPWNRVELSFKAPRSVGDNGFIKLESGNIGGPMVLNHFEPRYFKFEDYLKSDEDGFYNFGNLDIDTVTDMCKDLGIPNIGTKETNPEAQYDAQDAAVQLMGNWEKVCKWIYSTNLENVNSQGSYSPITLYRAKYEPGIYYVSDGEEEVNGALIPKYKLDEGTTFNPEIIYYVKEISEEDGSVEYKNAHLTDDNNLVYQTKKYYILVSGEDEVDENKKIYALSDEAFSPDVTYYNFTSDTDDVIAEKADLLVAPASEYEEGVDYYTYNSEATVIKGGGKTAAVQKINNPSAEGFAQGGYYVAAPKTYVNTTYKYDTKEYRTAKFINEIKEHFDMEYLATYFIMTEVFECYDSRGKNCMMASWGPQKENGEYIWYPIFYDIDTQLGINNTGIPSFEYNVDATDAGNYSTSDSILWNNFYKFFKGSQILNKYKNLRNQKSTFANLAHPPLQSVDYLEKWYTFDPDVTGNIANKGKRPLVATNLDMFYKYITITNPASIDQGVAYLDGEGEYTVDEQGTYFYALQGDRSQSRRQFLTNRLEYIDSWLGQGNYKRGGSNRIRGRISANSERNGTTSDWWVETKDDPYWVNGQEFGEKTHDFDAEYWLTLKPIRSAYVTAGDDSANYPSEKYDGIHTVKYKLNDIAEGVRSSRNYPEQLVYIYGMNQMADFGEMNKLYWTEFYMEGNADHLTRLQLGYDGVSFTEEKEGREHVWYNQKLNGITLSDMPLLKEANFSGITLSTQTPLDLTKSEKLENFRAVRTSNLTEVKFAEGVALNTLYLPESVSSLKLVQANLLDNVIAEDTPPKPINNEDGTVTPPTRGLYIDGFFKTPFSSNITNLNLNGGALGHGSYKLLDVFYRAIKAKPSSSTIYRIAMTDVNWCPYIQLTEGSVYDEEKTYYIDNGHYGFNEWTKVASKFEELVTNGKLYIYEENDSFEVIGDNFIPMLMDMADAKNINFADAISNSTVPSISGIVYIDNSDATDYYEESVIRETYQKAYPNLKFFFKNVKKAYSATFLFRNPNTGKDEYVPHKDNTSSTLPSVLKISQNDYNNNKNIWFSSPFNLYAPERKHYVFLGWSTDPDATRDNGVVIKNTEEWNKLRIDSETWDYTYYAIFEIDSYDVIFLDGDGSVLEGGFLRLPYGTE